MTTNYQPGGPIDILLVEDSPTDARLTIEALHEAKLHNTIHHVVDGEQALLFLRREGKHAGATRPHLVLLDLKLPKIDGHQVLQAIRADPNLKCLIVVVLTTSADERDVLKAYGLNCNAYITKPVDLEQFLQVVRDIKHFYLEVVTLPAAE